MYPVYTIIGIKTYPILPNDFDYINYLKDNNIILKNLPLYHKLLLNNFNNNNNDNGNNNNRNNNNENNNINNINNGNNNNNTNNLLNNYLKDMLFILIPNHLSNSSWDSIHLNLLG